MIFVYILYFLEKYRQQCCSKYYIYIDCKFLFVRLLLR